MGGVKLTGKIKSFDKFSLVLESGNLEQLIFKHAISTISVPRGVVHHPRPEGIQHPQPQERAQAAQTPAPAVPPRPGGRHPPPPAVNRGRRRPARSRGSLSHTFTTPG